MVGCNSFKIRGWRCCLKTSAQGKSEGIEARRENRKVGRMEIHPPRKSNSLERACRDKNY